MLVAIREACRRSAGLTLVITVMLLMLLASAGLSAVLYGVSWLYATSYNSLVLILQGDWVADPNGADKFRLIQFAYQWISWALTAGLMYRLVYPGQNALQIKEIRSFWFWLAPLIMVASLPMVSMLHLDAESFHLPASMASLESWIKGQETMGQQMLERVLSEPSAIGWNLLVFAVTPAVCEELFFRGWIQKQFGRFLSPHATVWVSAAIFSFIHLQFLGFISRLILGAVLGYQYQYSKSLLPSMVSHAVFNSISVIGVAMGMSMEQEPGALQGLAGWGLALLSGGLTWAGLQYFRQLSQRTSLLPPA